MGLSHAGDVAAGRRQVPVSAVFFDCLEIDGHDLRDVPLAERKQLLELLIPRGTGVLGYSAHVEERGKEFFHACDALHLGVYDGDRLVYVSKVGTGFDATSLKRIRDRLKPLAREQSPFDVGTPTGRGHHWVEPK